MILSCFSSMNPGKGQAMIFAAISGRAARHRRKPGWHEFDNDGAQWSVSDTGCPDCIDGSEVETSRGQMIYSNFTSKPINLVHDDKRLCFL